MIYLEIPVGAGNVRITGQGGKIVDQSRTGWRIALCVQILRDVCGDGAELILRNNIPGKRLIARVAATHHGIQRVVNLTDVDLTSAGVHDWSAIENQRPAKEGTKIATQ